MNKKDTKRKKIIYIMMILQILICILIGMKKEGFHEDEYYSYYSSNRTLGLYVTDNSMVSTDTIKDEFVVLPGEGFNYKLVKTVQSWDVHPPMYYYVLHTACSILPELFSKWIGIAINIIFLILSSYFLAKIMDLLQIGDMQKYFTIIIWSINPITLSFVMFTRMYMMLSFFILLCTYLHVRLLQTTRAMNNGLILDKKDKIFDLKLFAKYMLPIMLCSFFGFLTHYYYLIYFVGIGIYYCLWLFVQNRKSKDKISKFVTMTITYVISCAVSLALAIIYYPSALSQIFGGYRGKEAFSAFSDLTNVFARILYFLKLLNNGVFFYTFIIFIVLFLIGYFVLGIRPRSESLMMVFASSFYFIVVAKTCLILGTSSHRYEMPIYSIIIMLCIEALVQFVSETLTLLESKGFTLKGKYIDADAISGKIFIGLVAVFTIVSLHADFVSDKVLFLYEDEAKKIEFASSHSTDAVIIVYNSAAADKVFWMTNEILEYENVYYLSLDSYDNILDDGILKSDEIVVYLADCDDSDKVLTSICSQCESNLTYSKISSKTNWTTYLLSQS